MHMPPHPQWCIRLGTRGVITDVITHAKFFVNQFSGFGVLILQQFAISMGLAGRSFNSVSTAVLYCDIRSKLVWTVHCASAHEHGTFGITRYTRY